MPDTRDSVQAVESDVPPPSGGASARKKGHRVLVPALLVLATIVGIAGAFAVWVNRQALNTSNWAATSGKILDDKRVQDAVSAYMVRELFTNVDVPGALQKTLPAQLRPLAGPAAAGLQQLAGQLAPRVLASPQAQAAWVQANVAAHKQLLNVLNGGGPVVSTQSGVVTLNLHTLTSQLAATLGISSQVAAAQSKLQGSTGASGRAEAQQKLGITVPPANGQLVILRSNQLRTAQDVANGIKGLAIVLPALATVLFALAVYLARGRRRRTLRTTGWCLVLIGLVLLLIRRVGGDAVVDGLVKVPSNKPAVHDVWNIATSLLYNIAVAMVVYGLVFVVAAWLAGPTRPAIAIRKALAPSLRDHPAGAYLVAGGALALAVLWGPTPALRNIWWILVFAALLALGVTMLRRETAIEFPDIEPGQALHDFSQQRAQAGAREAAAAQLAAAGTSAGRPAAHTAPPAPGSERVDSLERLAALRDRGAITDDEYQVEKTLVINNHT
jgi:Short C-terminal domain